MPARADPPFPPGYDLGSFNDGTVTRDVIRSRAPGPVVILLHEAGGINSRVMAVATTLIDAGLSPVLPVLVDKPRPTTSAVQLGRNFVGICLAREFGAFATNQSAPITAWLRALAEAEHGRAGGRGVGVIGMCFSGGFALAMVTLPIVQAAVVSQPGLPLPLPGRRAALTLSPEEIDTVADRAEEGFCVRMLRYQLDFKSPGARMRWLVEILPNASVVEIPTWNPNRHSVLADAVGSDADSDLGRALSGTIDYLVERLLP